MPVFNNIKDIENNPSSLLSRSYDLVLNGIELGGGSIRINNTEIQTSILKSLDLKIKRLKINLVFLLTQ